MKVYLLAIFVVAAALWAIWRRNSRNGVRWRELLIDTAWLGVGVLFFSAARNMWVYPPLMLLHLAASTLFAWGFMLRLRGRKTPWFYVIAPLFTLLLFVAVAWFFREV